MKRKAHLSIVWFICLWLAIELGGACSAPTVQKEPTGQEVHAETTMEISGGNEEKDPQVEPSSTEQAKESSPKESSPEEPSSEPTPIPDASEATTEKQEPVVESAPPENIVQETGPPEAPPVEKPVTPEKVPPDFCETKAGTCRYIDPVNGKDSNAGTYDSPWRSFVKVNVSIYGKYRPKGWVGLKPGDIVYLKSGVYQDIYHPGHDNGPTGGGSFIFFAQNAKGTAAAPIQLKAFPGHKPIFDPKNKGNGITLLYSEYIIIDGIEIRNANGRGIELSGSSNIKVKHVNVHDTDGSVGSNIAGMEIKGSKDIEVSHSTFYDNYDRSAAKAGKQTHNSCNFVLFSNRGSIKIHSSIFYNTKDRNGQYNGCGIKYKHAATELSSTFALYNNYFENHKYFAIGIGTANAHIHHNIINGASTALDSSDHGGPTHQSNQVFEYNTIYDAPAFHVSPTLRWQNHKGIKWPGLKDIKFQYNIAVDLSSRYNSDKQLVNLNSYMSDTLFTALKKAISFTKNCYQNLNTKPSFGFAGSKGSGSLGGYHDLASWQKTYQFDLQSKIATPQYTDPKKRNFRLKPNSPCKGFGAYTAGYQPPIKK